MPTQQRRIKAQAQKDRAYDEALKNPIVVNRARASQQAQDYAASSARAFPSSSASIGHFLPSDHRDEEYQARMEIAKTPGWKDMHTISEGMVDYVVDKKKKEHYLRYLQFGEYLQDPSDPRTQDDMYALIPELREVPDSYHKDMLALQEQLRVLIADGRIRSTDDLNLLMRISAPDFILPVLPAWDPTGILVGKLEGFANLLSKYARPDGKRGFFANRLWSGSDGGQPTQETIKRLILIRLLPGVRNHENPALAASNLIREASKSSWSGKPISNYAGREGAEQVMRAGGYE